MVSPLTADAFDTLVAEALDGLPEQLGKWMSNVHVVVEEIPSEDKASELPEGHRLLGLYEGIPLTSRDSGYYGVLPDRITLYKNNLESAASSAAELREAVRRTVIHEVAHHFGIDDDRLEALGWA